MIAGGQENMSASPHVLPGSRDGFRMGDAKLIDSMIVDGLWDAFNQYHMGMTAENVAKEYGISREDAGRVRGAVAEQGRGRAEGGQASTTKSSPIDIPQKKGEPLKFATDEFVRHGVTAESLAGLRPAFSKEGTVTAANASGLNDGAAAVIVMSAKKAEALGLTPIARIKAYATRASIRRSWAWARCRHRSAAWNARAGRRPTST